MGAGDVFILNAFIALICGSIMMAGGVIWYRGLGASRSKQNWILPLGMGGVFYVTYKTLILTGGVVVTGFDHIEYTIVYLTGILTLKGYFAPIILSTTLGWSVYFLLTEGRFDLLPVYNLILEGAGQFAPPWFATAYIIVAILFVFWRTFSTLSGDDALS